MADDKKSDEKKNSPPPAHEPTLTITPSMLSTLVAAEVAKLHKSKDYDEALQESLDHQRGKDRPIAPEELIPCRSPTTGAVFTARVIKSRATPGGRIVELLDYVRPDAAEKHVEDGGMYGGPREWMRTAEVGHPLDKGQHKYRHWLYSAFWLADWNALSGKPASFLAQWRVTLPSDKAAE